MNSSPPPNHIQNVVDETNKAVVDALRNRVVINAILENMSDTDLRNVSLVNKLWNGEARKEMRKRGSFIAHITFNPQSSCQDVKAFGSAIEQMNVVPFSGVNISLNGLNHCYACATGILDPIDTKVLGRLSWRHLAIQRDNASWPPENCPAVLLAKTVLQDFGGVLQELTLQMPIMRNLDEIIQELVQGCCFPQLRTLKYTEVLTSHEQNLKNLMGLVSRAPNLKELHSGMPINLLQNVLKGSSIVYVCGYFIGACFQEISEDIINNLRLEYMSLKYTGPRFDFDRFNRIIPMVLETCCTTTLHEMDLDAIFLVPLMFYGTCLRNVRNLYMNLDNREPARVQPQVLRFLKNFDFMRIFPNLNKLHIRISRSGTPELLPEHLNTIIEQANAVWQEPLPDRAENIKQLFISCFNSVLSRCVVQFLGEMFPNIEQLEISGESDSETPFGSIWKHWVHLEKLDVGQFKLEHIANLDSAFCGIFPEEVAELIGKDEEYLKTVNIVPVMPSITCLKNLRILEIDYPNVHIVQKISDPSFIFSKVTRLTAFKRFRNLTVMVRISQHRFFTESYQTNQIQTDPAHSLVVASCHKSEGNGDCAILYRRH